MTPVDVPGHLPEPIGRRLADLAAKVPATQAVVEVGSYLGRSACFLASGAQQGFGAHVWAVDAWDLPGPRQKMRASTLNRFNDPTNLGRFRHNVAACGVADRVTAIQAFSVDAARDWDGPPIGLLFIDGDHSLAGVTADWDAWTPHLASGGVVAFDDAGRERSGKWGVKGFVAALGLPVERVHDGRLAIVRP